MICDVMIQRRNRKSRIKRDRIHNRSQIKPVCSHPEENKQYKEKRKRSPANKSNLPDINTFPTVLFTAHQKIQHEIVRNPLDGKSTGHCSNRIDAKSQHNGNGIETVSLFESAVHKIVESRPSENIR